MSPEIGKAGFAMALFIVIGALAMLLVVPRDSAEFAITVVTLFIGLAFSAVIAILIRVSSR